MNSAVGISPYFTIPKGVDRVEGGCGGFSSHSLRSIQLFADYSVVPVLPAGLRLAAAAALKALAESGRSTVFFEHIEDVENTSGTAHTHIHLSIQQAKREVPQTTWLAPMLTGSVWCLLSHWCDADGEPEQQDRGTEQPKAANTATAGPTSPTVSGSPRSSGDNPLAAFLGSYR